MKERIITDVCLIQLFIDIFKSDTLQFKTARRDLVTSIMNLHHPRQNANVAVLDKCNLSHT